jgi:hypothetical protein
MLLSANTKTITVLELLDDAMPDNPAEFIKMLSDALAQIPEGFRGAAELKWSADYSGEIGLWMQYTRPKTEQELAAEAKTLATRLAEQAAGDIQQRANNLAGYMRDLGIKVARLEGDKLHTET